MTKHDEVLDAEVFASLPELLRAGYTASCIICRAWFKPRPGRRLFCDRCPPAAIREPAE